LPRINFPQGSWRWYGSFLISVALAILADRLSKVWVEADLTLDESRHLLGPLSFTHVNNPSGAWGLGAPQPIWVILSLLAIALIIALLFYFRDSTRRRTLAAVGLGLLFGGSVSNLADRLFSEGVTDFIDIHLWGDVSWPTFNIADIAIVIGAALLGVSLLRIWKQPKDSEPECNFNEDSS
jgi:signal peptidase II